jgi:hypothetical protein
LYHNVTVNTLREYERNKPLADNLVATNKELKKAIKERDSYKKGLEREKLWNRLEERQRWLIVVPEYDKAIKELHSRTGNSSVGTIDQGNLKNMVMDVYYHPSKNVQVISQMMNTYNLEHK